MTISPLYSSRVKLSRASHHLMEFEKAIDAFSERNPNAVITDEDTQPGSKLDRFTIREKFPSDFSSFIGDTAHNLMSALDSLAVALAKKCGPLCEKEMRHIYFPIHWEDEAAKGKAERFFKRISPEIRQIVEAVESQDRANGRYLYWLHTITFLTNTERLCPSLPRSKESNITFLVKIPHQPRHP